MCTKRDVLTQVTVFIVLFLISKEAFSQKDSSCSFSANLDITNSYIWRGTDQGHLPSIQPALSMSWKNFTIGAWSAFKITGDGKNEIDFYISKTVGFATFSIYDYWTYGDSLSNNFFDYKQSSTSHLLEAQLFLSGGEKIPFSLLAGYFFYGADITKSLYIELQYKHRFTFANMLLFAGCQAKGEYYASRRSFINIGGTFSRDIAITKNYDIGVSMSLIVNPEEKRTYFVANIAF